MSCRFPFVKPVFKLTEIHYSKIVLSNFISRLSGKLLILTIIFVLLAEAVIFLPSASNFRKGWLEERAISAGHLAIALNAAPESYDRQMLSETFMRDTDISVVRVESMGRTELVLGSPPETMEFEIIDLRSDNPGLQLRPTLAAFTGKDGYFRVLANPPPGDFQSLEYLVPKAALQKAMEKYCHNILGLSILIAIITGILLYSVLRFLIVKPLQCLGDDVAEFQDDPSAPLKTKRTHNRKDEIGDLSRAFTEMQTGVQSSLEQRKRLADLGLAVSKINHDLRNVLTSAQLVSDRLAMDKDERVKKMGERLVRAVDRGVRIAEGVLEYGSDKEEILDLSSVNLAEIADEAAHDTLRRYDYVQFENKIDPKLQARADADHTYRIFQNLIRNAAQALKDQKNAVVKIEARNGGDKVYATLADNGPGLPEKVREAIFTPFSTGGGRGRTGLGLTISKELAEAQGGDLTLLRSDQDGTAFELILSA